MDEVFNVGFFQLPNVFAQFSCMLVFWVLEQARVVVISCLECAFCKSNVGFFMLVICSGYCGLVHNAFCEAFSFLRQLHSLGGFSEGLVCL